MRILIIGLGLIGGSFAKAVRQYTNHKVYAMDTDQRVLESAAESGVIDGAAESGDIGGFDLLIIALYPEATIAFLKRYAADFSKSAIVIDTCGIKGFVCEKARPIAEKHGFCFIGAHPMAGRERGGLANSSAGLFYGASFIAVPSPNTDRRCDELEKFARSIGFAKFVRTTPERHDKMIAYTSQLPHLLACAYILNDNAPFHDGFSAGSFRDVSRVALINEELWTQLFLDNRAALTEQADRLIDNLTLLRNAVDQGNCETIKSMLRKGRQIKERITP